MAEEPSQQTWGDRAGAWLPAPHWPLKSRQRGLGEQAALTKSRGSGWQAPCPAEDGS